MPEAPAARCLSFDFGTRRIGVAAGNTVTGTVSGIASIAVGAGDNHLTAIEELVREWRADLLVVGLPLDAGGGETATSRAARAFGEALGRRTGLPVYWVNEFLTSAAAQAQLTETIEGKKRFSRRRQAGRDLLAAELILRSYLESLPARR